MRIDGKVVVITGASEGIGAACAKEFQSRGARLVLTARSEDKLRAVSQGRALIIPGDLTGPEVRASVIRQALEAHGAVDVLINCAGVGLYASTWEADLNEVRAMFELNVFSALGMIQETVPHMRARRSGCIVNINSLAGQVALPWFTLYSATKHALTGMTDGLRMELAGDGVHVMNVFPAYVKTGFQDHVLGGAPPERLRRSKKFATTPEACARAIAKAVETGARDVVVPRKGRLITGMWRVVPRFVEAQFRVLHQNRSKPL